MRKVRMNTNAWRFNRGTDRLQNHEDDLRKLRAND